MASNKDYLEFILEQLTDLDGVSCRAMMGEYILYVQGKVVGGIYDDRLLVKPVKSAVAAYPDAPLEEPYPGGKAMLLVDDVDDRNRLCAALRAVADELPAPKPKKVK